MIRVSTSLLRQLLSDHVKAHVANFVGTPEKAELRHFLNDADRHAEYVILLDPLIDGDPEAPKPEGIIKA